MNSTLKIILALILKFLLIILSVSGSFLIEGKLARRKAIENIKEVVLFERIDRSKDTSNLETQVVRQVSYTPEKISQYEPDTDQAHVINHLFFEIEL